MWAMTTIVKVALQKLEAAFAKNTDSSLEHTDIDTKTQSGCKAWHLCLFSMSVSFAASEPLSRLCSTLHVAILTIWEMCPGLQCMINLAHCPLELAWVSSIWPYASCQPKHCKSSSTIKLGCLHKTITPTDLQQFLRKVLAHYHTKYKITKLARKMINFWDLDSDQWTPNILELKPPKVNKNPMLPFVQQPAALSRQMLRPLFFAVVEVSELCCNTVCLSCL